MSMNLDFADTFDRHEIRSSIVQENFGSWLLMRRHPPERAGEDGGFTGVFWCRITAADGLLRVSGDFDPTIFQGHLGFKDDPSGRVAWMGAQTFLSPYVCEKARMGSTREACTSWDVDGAYDDLRELKQEYIDERDDDAPLDVDPGDGGPCDYVKACDAGLETLTQYDGQIGVHEIIEAVYFSGDVELEHFNRVGKRPSQGLKLAHRAVMRLHVLLEAEEAMNALRAHIESKKTHGQKALVWRVADGVNVLSVHGEALTFDDPETAIEELLVWDDDKPSAVGLWLWEGWAYVTEGSYEHVIGGEFRRLNVWESDALRNGQDVFAVKPPKQAQAHRASQVHWA